MSIPMLPKSPRGRDRTNHHCRYRCLSYVDGGRVPFEGRDEPRRSAVSQALGFGNGRRSGQRKMAVGPRARGKRNEARFPQSAAPARLAETAEQAIPGRAVEGAEEPTVQREDPRGGVWRATAPAKPYRSIGFSPTLIAGPCDATGAKLMPRYTPAYRTKTEMQGNGVSSRSIACFDIHLAWREAPGNLQTQYAAFWPCSKLVRIGRCDNARTDPNRPASGIAGGGSDSAGKLDGGAKRAWIPRTGQGSRSEG